MATGALQIVTASWRCAASSIIRPLLGTQATKVFAPWVTISSLTANGSSVWIQGYNAAASAPAARFKLGLPLKPGFSITFSGVGLGSGAVRNLSIGTQGIYGSSAVNQRLMVTYPAQG